MSLEDWAAVLAAHLPQAFAIFAATAGMILLAIGDLLVLLAIVDVEVIYEPPKSA